MLAILQVKRGGGHLTDIDISNNYLTDGWSLSFTKRFIALQVTVLVESVSIAGYLHGVLIFARKTIS